MRAVILAAGKSTRLHPITLDKPKCLLELEVGKTILDYQISAIKSIGISDIIVAVGHQRDLIENHLGLAYTYHYFPEYAEFNNLHTLYSMRGNLTTPTVIFYSDVLFTPSLLKKCVDSSEDFCLLVHNTSILENTARVKIKNEGVVDVGNHISLEESDGNFIGIAKFSKLGIVTLLNAIEHRIGDKNYNNAYYITPIGEIAKSMRVGYAFAYYEPWCEIDILEDYERAKKEIYPKIKLSSK